MQRFIKAVATGPKRSRDLTWEEARDAMTEMVESADPAQIGAFLVGMRMKGERPMELAGFATILQERAQRMPCPQDTIAIDAHGDGHEGVLSLLPAAICAMAAAGVPAWLDVEMGSPFARHGLDGGLRAIGCDGALDPDRGLREIARRGVAVVDLVHACWPLARLVGMRSLLGVRTLAQTVMKMVSVSVSRRRALGVFHAPTLQPLADAMSLSGSVDRGLVIHALGGLPEVRPGKIVRVAYVGQPGVHPLDLRPLTDDAPPSSPALCDTQDQAARDEAALRANRAALDGDAALAPHAAATAGVLMHAATGEDPVAAGRRALAALREGRARTVADRR